MAVLTMKRIRICALAKDRKPLLEYIQRRGVIQLQNDLEHDEIFSRPDGSAARAGFDRSVAAARQALEELDRVAPEKKGLLAGLQGLKSLTPGQLTDCVKHQTDTLRAIGDINAAAKQIAEDRARIPRLKAQIAGLEPWKQLEVPLSFSGTRATRAFIGSFAMEHTQEELLSSIALPDGVNIDLTVISHTKEQTCVFVVCARRDADAVEGALRTAGFALPALDSALIPTEQIAKYEAEIAASEDSIVRNTETLKGFARRRSELQLFIDYYTVRSEKYAAWAELAQSRHTVILSGYITERDAPSLISELEKRFSAVCELRDPAPEEAVPVALRNNAFTAPMEGVLSSFSLPGKGEFDPSTMMALCYYILFGMMLSDAGYGLLIVIICGILLARFKNMAEGMKKSLRMFFFSGISTAFWGFMYGSFFGDAPAAISRLFGDGSFALKPIWIDPISCPMQMLMFCLLIGVIHLFIGLGCKAYLCIRGKDMIGLLADVIAWYLLIGGLILFAMSSPAFLSIVQLDFCLPAVFGTAGTWMALAGAAIVLLFGGRESKNPVLRLVKGLYALYGSTSWLGDILSYSRLLALGLATGVIGQVVNQMACMGGKNPVGYAMFVLVFLVGHTLNIAINLLGAYVHTNRLQFVEFFGKFYEGGGEPFSPLATHTQYYRF